MQTLLNDVRYAARKLLRTPGFTVIAVATLALAIGATTAVFSIVNSVLLEPLPFAQPDRLVQVASIGRLGKPGAMSWPDFKDYRDQTSSFVGMAAIDIESANLTAPGVESQRLQRAEVGANFFSLLGTRMQAGRAFLAGEDVNGAAPVTVISDKLWRSNYGADPTLLGRTIALDGINYQVIGIAQPGGYPAATDLWTPLIPPAWAADPSGRGAHWLDGIGRVKPGVTVDQAKRDIVNVGERLRLAYQDDDGEFHATIVPLSERVVGNFREPLVALMGAVAFVLLIACANVANLLLVRAASRESEMAVRTALGAGRGRIVRQLVTESVLLSLVAAALGCALAAWIVDAVAAFGPTGLPRLNEISVNGRVLVFSVGVAVVTGVLFGLVPAFHAARTSLGQVLREGTRGGSGQKAAQRTRNVLVMTEMALAVILLIGAGLLIHSFARLTAVDPGFRAENVVTFDVSVPDSRYAFDRNKNQFTESVLASLRKLPRTRSAAAAFSIPLAHVNMATTFTVDGRPPLSAEKRMLTEVHPVTPGYFATMGIRLVRGRAFTAGENTYAAPQVLVISQALADKYFPGEDPIGKRLSLGIGHDTAQSNTNVDIKGEIVGIVADVKQRDLATPPAASTYIGYGTFPQNAESFVVRTQADPAMVMRAVRDNVRQIDPNIPVYNLQTMQQVLSGSVAQPRFYMTLLASFAALALLLAALGIYGVISYSVSQRSRELGIRIALGATREGVVKLVLGQGMALTVTGAVAGLLGAYGLTRLIANLLFGVPPLDTLTFATVPLVLIAVAWVASYIPARRAARVDPVTAIRAD